MLEVKDFIEPDGFPAGDYVVVRVSKEITNYTGIKSGDTITSAHICEVEAMGFEVTTYTQGEVCE